jgi:hypothetical protein
MAYWDQSQLSQDNDFIFRIAACAAVEVDLVDQQQPREWALANVWFLAASPGFSDAYSSAVVGGVPNPGRDPAVISDSEILSAVQAHNTP